MRGFFLFFLAALPVYCQADAVADLQALLKPLISLSGEFEQGLYAEDGEQLEVSSGEFSLLQPDNFRWVIEKPEAQLVVVSGGYLWHHDVELETVTRRSVDLRSTYSPLAVLAGDEDSLRNDYVVESLPGREDLTVWRLVPREGSADFRELILYMRDGEPQQMDVLDPLERLSRIEFDAVTINPPLSPVDFEFTVPAGADFFQHD